jgi:transcriptional regulator with XRE-family HTH domain
MKMTIGENIKLLRKKAKLTQHELALRANISRSYLADIERNRYNPSVETIKDIAQALNVPISSIIDGTSETDLPNLTKKDERDIQKKLQEIINDLNSKDGYAALDGKSIDELDEEDRELLIASLENSLRLAKKIAKQKFTPKKYRK